MSYCQEHKNSSECIYFDLSKCKNLCAKCITANRCRSENLILIEDLFSCNDNKIIDNWPILDSNKQFNLQQDMKFIFDSIQKDDVKELITKYYEQFKQTINQAIDFSYEEQIKKSKYLDDIKYEVIAIYKNISELDQFKKLWCESLTKEQNIKELSQFIQNKHKQRQINSNLIEQCLLKYRERLDLLSFEQTTELSQRICQMIQKIDVYKIENFNDYFEDLDKIYLDRSQQKSQGSVQKILKLISNKTNFCNNKFLQEVQKQLSKVKHHLEIINFSNIYQENIIQPIDFEMVSDQHLKQLEDFIQGYNVAQKQKLLSQNETSLQQNLHDYIEFKKLFKNNNENYDEFLKTVFVIGNYHKNVNLKNIQFIKQAKNQEMKIIKKDNYNIQFVVLYPMAHNNSLAYGNFILNSRVNYLFRYKIDTNDKNSIYKVGLIKDCQKNTENIGIYFLHDFSDTQKQPSFIQTTQRDNMKNNNQNPSQYNTFEIRINIQQKYIIKADFPNYNNIQRINHDFINNDYRFCFTVQRYQPKHGEHSTQSCSQNLSISLIHCETVDEFDMKIQ